MAQFQAFRPDVEVYGAAVLTLVDGMGHFTTTAYKILAKNGIEKPKPDQWYPQQAWLDNPYPSEFDRGIITSLSRRFKPHCEVKLDPDKPSRTEGGDSCTYIIEW
jgi:hypothetical protein